MIPLVLCPVSPVHQLNLQSLTCLKEVHLWSVGLCSIDDFEAGDCPSPNQFAISELLERSNVSIAEAVSTGAEVLSPELKLLTLNPAFGTKDLILMNLKTEFSSQ